MAFFVLVATLAQNATPQTAAALSVMQKRGKNVSKSKFDEIYDLCSFYMEDGDVDSLAEMNWSKITEICETELNIKVSPKAHYLLATNYILKGQLEPAMGEKLKAASVVLQIN